MFLGQQLKSRLHSLQEDIKAGVHYLAPSTSASEETSTSVPQQSTLSVDCGHDLLDRFQANFADIRRKQEKNVRLADDCADKIMCVHAHFDAQFGAVHTLQLMVSNVPKVNEQIMGIVDQLGELESLFNDAEIALIALEDTIDARERQEMQTAERQQLERLQHQRNDQLAKLQEDLRRDYVRRREAVDNERFLASKTKSFAKPSKPKLLQVPERKDADASLETVDLDADDDEANAQLEAFLDDVSPLPKDDTPIRLLKDEEEEQNEPAVEAEKESAS